MSLSSLPWGARATTTSWTCSLAAWGPPLHLIHPPDPLLAGGAQHSLAYLGLLPQQRGRLETQKLPGRELLQGAKHVHVPRFPPAPCSEPSFPSPAQLSAHSWAQGFSPEAPPVDSSNMVCCLGDSAVPKGCPKAKASRKPSWHADPEDYSSKQDGSPLRLSWSLCISAAVQTTYT